MESLSLFKALFLGFLQGATEFLPVSSSGHLVLAQHFLGLTLEGQSLLAFDVCLHFGTLLAVLAYFWRDLSALFLSAFASSQKAELSPRESRTFIGMVVLGTIPAVIIGLGFKDFFEQLTHEPKVAAVMLLITGTLLLATHFAKQERIGMKNLKAWQAFVVGVFQAIAILPGISRSGTTIAAALYLKFNRDFAAKFSFFLAIPAIAGATILSIDDLKHFSGDMLFATALGTLVSFLVGYACIKWLMRIIRKGKIAWFGVYCWAVGIVALLCL
ncbi:MAG: hypothetical protein COX62_07675 [Deltaproteobacteria bacterium CG_4_10_14_0_2_um_filter_43_8]|nr:MAG: hypothetical protein COV43_01035 [Deltaproteobacteria bacterium CG11_big_fil_rev_8_21_14_0_20_42_23]PJA18960.1 MAG: hypothetical protein COX62_07675 [Deltaproteobacteria bacterium CG_4_10_14_0_2_um_filter_43_8]PJC63562.1 MAG: hypothetical protein CO021_08955 [Deltaproteobacteria bacterium CG_4_9_14_0_2_um_filter_42_21]